MAIFVFIYGCTEDGDPFHELSRNLVFDVRGRLIELESPVVNGLRVLAVNENTGEDVECCVAYTQKSRNRKTEVEITFEKPSPNFCGIKFSSEDYSPSQKTYANARHFIDGGKDPVSAEMYRRLMVRAH
jgi:hypothetical protein